jgi:hypothetical protein
MTLSVLRRNMLSVLGGNENTTKTGSEEKAMPDNEWRDKVFVKKRWNLDDDELVDVVFKKILIPYWKRPDGVYMPLSYEISSSEEGCAYHRWMNVWYQCNENKTRAISVVEIGKELDSDYIWFKQNDIDNAECKGKLKLADAEKKKPAGRRDKSE